MKKINYLLLATFLISAQFLVAQTNESSQSLTMGIPEVLLINAVDASGATGAVSLELTTTTAGTAITGGSGTSYAQVSSIVNSGQTRTIQAKIDAVPAGTTLSVTAGTPTSGNGDGTFGSSAGSVVLTTTNATIISGVGSCYTGIAALDGYVLDWVWDVATGSYGSIVASAGSTTVVTLTISAGS